MMARNNERRDFKMFLLVLMPVLLLGGVDVLGVKLGMGERLLPFGVIEIVLEIAGVPVGLLLGQMPLGEPAQTKEGVA